MTSIRRAIPIIALVAFAIGAMEAAIAGKWGIFVLAVLGGAAVALWPRPAR